MARHEYVCYELHNPMITSWNHNKVDYSQGGVHDFDMKLNYEAVSYSIGSVSEDQPEGFGMSHYDSVPSPLSGLVPPTPGPTLLSSSTIGGSATSILNSVLTQINTAQNTKQPGAAGVSIVGAKTQQTLNGLQGFAFPVAGLLK